MICLHQEIVGTRILTLVCPNIISFTTRQSMEEEEKTKKTNDFSSFIYSYILVK